MYRTILFILAAFIALAFQSCQRDDTTLPTRALSEITITEGTIYPKYNVSKNDSIVLTPQVTQSNTQLPLRWTWEIDQRVVSHDNVLRYRATQLGNYHCRLIVENEDGKTFFPFTINVVSLYQKGIAILSQDDEGHSMLSFLLDRASVAAPGEAITGDTYRLVPGEAFSVNNPDYTFADRAVDMVHSGSTLIIACQGHRTAANPNPDQVPTIYYLHDKTFVLQNAISVPEYPDFIPTQLGIPSIDASSVAYPVLCQNGRIYEFSTTERAISEPSKFTSTYAQTSVVWDDGSGYNFDIIYWDTKVGALCEFHSGYGPFYCSETYHLRNPEECVGEANYFNNHKIVRLVNIQQTDAQRRTHKPEILVVTKNAIGMFYKTRLLTYFWEYDSELGANHLGTNGGLQTAGMGATPFSESSPCVACQTYNSMLFAGGNTIYRWNYTTQQMLTKATVHCTLGSPQAVITDLLLSPDHSRTYVAVDDPAEAPMTGSVYVIDTDNGTVLESYRNICHRPVRIINKRG